MPANPNAATDPAFDAARLLSLEQRLLQPVTRRSVADLQLLLHPDFREFGSSGRTFSRDAIINELAREQPAEILLEDFACRPLAPTLALVTYRARRPAASIASLRSSIWTLQDGRWQLLFHQGTRIH